MKSTSVHYSPGGSIELREQTVTDPNANEVQLQGGACGICSWDIATVKLGEQMQPKAPPGHEGVGYVVKVGRDVTGLKEGDRVAGGGFSTIRNLTASQVYKLPESSTLADEHWLVEPVSCVVTGLEHCRLRPGDRVAVIGTGFMGLLLLQGLRHSAVSEIVAIDVRASRLELAQRLGVNAIYNAGHLAEADLADALELAFDVVVDTTGVQAGLDLASRLVKKGGLINLFGWLKGEKASFNPTAWHLGGFTVVNSSPSSALRDPFPAAIRLIHNGVFDLQALVTHVETLEKYPALMDNIVKGDETYLKGVVKL